VSLVFIIKLPTCRVLVQLQKREVATLGSTTIESLRLVMLIAEIHPTQGSDIDLGDLLPGECEDCGVSRTMNMSGCPIVRPQ
jgi:hypothetical protein